AYLQSEFESGPHPLRATADLCRKFPLDPATAQIVLPAFTSPTAVVVDSSQNTNITQPATADTEIVSATTTIGAVIQASRQLLDMSSQESRIDEVIAADLGEAYDAQLDSAVLTGSGSGGQLPGLLSLSGISSVAAASSVAGLVDGVATGAQVMVQTRYRAP